MSESLLDVLENPQEKRSQAERINGVVPGIVTNTQDPETMGRIKVKFPWLSDTSETDWVRVACFMAGAERGAFFLPEVDDEVLVAFEHGNIERPYVIGSLWSSVDKPPELNSDGKNNIKLYRSRSGHQITFSDDSEGKKEKIEIKTNAGHIVNMDDASGSEKIEVIDKTGSNKIVIDSTSNSITIECGQDLKLKATNVTIEASSALEFKGMTVKMESSTNLDIKAGAIATLKGSMVQIN